MSTVHEQIVRLEAAIAALEAQRAILGDQVVDTALAAMREKLTASIAVQSVPPDLRGERRQATILVADVKGSTALAEQVDIETWVEIMNRIFHLLGDAIYHYGGEIDQYRGDGLVAFFGAKAAQEDDPERALRAALAMQEAFKLYAAKLTAVRNIELLLRIGVNTGEVIAAEVGDRSQYSEATAMGRAVALAARMESAAQPGTVLVSIDTYQLTRPLFEWQALGEIWVKGISQPVAVYRPLAAIPVEGKGRGIEGLSSPLVGRDEEFAALQKAIDALQRGVGGIVTLVGDAGIGKSRLVAEVRKSTNLRFPHLQWIEGRCLSYGSSTAYLLWLDMLRGILRVPPDALPSVVEVALRALVQALCSDCFDAVYPYLCRLMSLPLDDQYAVIRDLHGESLRVEVFQAVQTLIESVVGQQPLVIVFEDLHWADVTSLVLLERILALTDRLEMLLICVFRPEVEHPCWQIKEIAGRLYRHRHTDLWLDALSDDESWALVANLLRLEDLPAELRSKILDYAEGNPFYVEEILRTMIDIGAIAFDDATRRWQATLKFGREIASIPIPDTLHGVLAARIDRLEIETRRVLRLASVIGRIFSYRVLAEIARDEAQLDMRLLTLQRQQLIRERARTPEVEYIFKHELTREAAYNGLLHKERRAIHRQVAEALERLFPALAEEQPGLLAHHWERADEPAKSVAYLLRAGEQARLAYANQEAIAHFKRGLVSLDLIMTHTKPRNDAMEGDVASCGVETWRLQVLSNLGKVYLATGQVTEAEQCFREAIALGQTTGLPQDALVRLYYWLGEALYWQRRYEERIDLGEQGLVLLAGDTESTEAALMNQTIAVSYEAFENWPRFFEITYRTAKFLSCLPYSEELRPAYIHTIIVHLCDKKVAEALVWIEELKQRATRHHDLQALLEAGYWSAITCSWTGNLRDALSQAKQALELYARIGDLPYQSVLMTLMGTATLSLGALQQAQTWTTKAIEVAQTYDVRLSAMVSQLAGQVFLCTGNTEEAIEAFGKTVELFGETSLWSSQVQAACHLGQAHLAQGDKTEAARCFQNSLTLAGQHELFGFVRSPIHLPVVTVTPVVQSLSRLEEIYQGTALFRVLCHRLRSQSGYEPFVQWALEPVTLLGICHAPFFQEEFGETLSPGWVWYDPFADCVYGMDDGLVVRAVNGRDLLYLNRSAPRLLRQATSNVVVQTVCGPALDDRPSIGGLLMWKDDRNYLRLDVGTFGRRQVALLGCLDDRDVVIGRGLLPGGGSEQVVLRLDHVDGEVRAFCRVAGDGQGQWYTVGQTVFVEGQLQAGVYAIGNIDRTIYRSAYPAGAAIRFESFEMWTK